MLKDDTRSRPRRKSGSEVMQPHVAREPRQDVALLIELRQTIQTLFDRLAAASAERQAATHRKLLLALELRCKVEELVLFPALEDARAAADATLQPLENEIARLRVLMDLAREPHMPAQVVRALMSALDGVATLHFARVERMLSRVRPDLRDGGTSLEDEMQAWLVRWEAEVDATGGIEDEEQDPVGLPPR